MKFTLEQAEYHRNGVGGNGFYTGIVQCDPYDDGKQQRMLVTFFPEHDEEGSLLPAGKDAEGNFANMSIAVYDVDLLATVGVKFGHNSWRGDHFCDVADALVAAVNAQYATA